MARPTCRAQEADAACRSGTHNRTAVTERRLRSGERARETGPLQERVGAVGIRGTLCLVGGDRGIDSAATMPKEVALEIPGVGL